MTGPERFRAALTAACEHAGLDPRHATVLHVRGNAVFHLARESAVVRLRPVADPADDLLARLTSAIEVTRWLRDQGFPTNEPLDVDQPIRVVGHAATFWKYVTVTSSDHRDAGALGRLIRRLHALPPPPAPLPAASPLGSLRDDILQSDAVTPRQQDWLLAAADELEKQSESARWVLGTGLVHGDAHVGNLLHATGGTVLCDWDNVSCGPRELDLVPTSLWRRYGRSPTEWDQFCAAYQTDPGSLPGLPLLQQIRQLHALAAYIRNASDPAYRAELARRITSLQTGNPTPWHAL